MPRVIPSEIIKIIDEEFSFAAKVDTNVPYLSQLQAPAIMAIISLIDRLPESLVQLPPDKFARYIRSLERLREDIRISSTARHDFPGHDVRHLRQLLAECPDESVLEAGHTLTFVSDAALRADLQTDIASAYSSLNDGRWKAATVLAGSVIEALLTWRLDRLNSTERGAAIEAGISDPAKRPSGPVEDWKLWQLIEVGKGAGFLREHTVDQATLTRHYRNFIHPGAAKRKDERVGKGVALGALAGLERVIEDVSR